jgi:hypothetical protein
VETIEDTAAVADVSVTAEDWLAEFEAGFAYIAGRSGRVEPRRRARAYLLGLLSDMDTRTCWQLAEQAGDRSPHRMQRLLGEAVWDADKVRDDVRGYVVDELGDPGAVLILDDTGDLKKAATVSEPSGSTPAPPGGSKTARSRCSWPTLPARVHADRPGGLPAPQLDRRPGPVRRRRPACPKQGYVLAVAKNHRVNTSPALGAQRADQITAALSHRAWNRYSAGAGAKANESTTGRGWPSSHPTTSRPGTTGCWCAAACPTAS